MTIMREDGSSRFPFQPNSPVDPRFFVGRKELVEKVTRYSAGAFSRRNIRIVYLSGYRGIGKTSLARYCRRVIEQRMDSWGFHVYLGGIQSGPKKLEDFLVKTISCPNSCCFPSWNLWQTLAFNSLYKGDVKRRSYVDR